ncbi:Hsp20/alpha crystallin family protein [Rubrobacter indicoceani]|uniref:Hsp20/alpha crystallin family protein n=1 Tax=Rubrobacter indicoceani TaxID=2051957 RepID=UPI000E5BD3EB|nr:Hsp20/alpha crystallin family protein [Rubrobacter indicoceani]
MLSPYRGRGFYDVQSEVNRLFDQMFGGLVRQGNGSAQRSQAGEWSPMIDVVQKEGDLVVRAELPGAKPEDVDMTVHNGVLTISGKREEEHEEERGGYLVRERRSGTFRRSLQLPEGIDEGAISARFENGILEATIQGAAAVREPKKIQIESSGSTEKDVRVQGGEEQDPGERNSEKA